MMAIDTWARRLLLATGAVALLLVGGLAYGPVASFAQDTPAAEETTAEVSLIESIEIAMAAHSESTAVEADRDWERGTLVYEVSFADGVDVEVDANTGEVIQIEQADHDQDHDDDDDRYDDDDD